MTNAERKWFDEITQLGCIIDRLQSGAFVPPERHHLLKGGKRIGHVDSIPLCAAHHRSGRKDDACVSRHPWKRAFEKRYGTEEFLLEKTRELVKACRPLTPEQIYRNRELHGHFGAGHS